MGFLDFLFGNKKEKERLERERLAEQERQRKAEEARRAKEREARLAENRRKEAERQALLKVEAERKQKEVYFQSAPTLREWYASPRCSRLYQDSIVRDKYKGMSWVSSSSRRRIYRQDI